MVWYFHRGSGTNIAGSMRSMDYGQPPYSDCKGLGPCALRLDQNIHVRPSTPRFLLRLSGSSFSYLLLAGAPFVARSAIPPLSCDTQNRPPVTSCCLTPTHPSLTGYTFVARLTFERLPTALLLGIKSPPATSCLLSSTHLPAHSNQPSLFLAAKAAPSFAQKLYNRYYIYPLR